MVRLRRWIVTSWEHQSENQMANKKQGNLTGAPQWWKHLRDWKRVFWKTERKAQQRNIKERLYE